MKRLVCKCGNGFLSHNDKNEVVCTQCKKILRTSKDYKRVNESIYEVKK